MYPARREQLPVEVCDLILGHVKDPSSLLSCAAVCRRWVRICRVRFMAQIDTPLRVPHGKHWEFVDILTLPGCSFLPMLTELQYEYKTLFPNTFSHLPLIPNLKVLRLVEEADAHWKAESWRHVPFRIPHIGVGGFANVTHLELVNTYFRRAYDLLDFIILFPNVSTLKLQSLGVDIRYRNNSCNWIPSTFVPQITSLTVDCDWDPDDFHMLLWGSYGHMFRPKELRWLARAPDSMWGRPPRNSLRRVLFNFTPWLEDLVIQLPDVGDLDTPSLRECVHIKSLELRAPTSYLYGRLFVQALGALPESIQRVKIVIEHQELSGWRFHDTLHPLLAALEDQVRRYPQLEVIHFHFQNGPARVSGASASLASLREAVEDLEPKLRARIPDHILSVTSEGGTELSCL